MPDESNKQAAEMHNIASHKHEAAAVQKEKQEHLSPHEMSRRAHEHPKRLEKRERQAKPDHAASEDSLKEGTFDSAKSDSQ